MERTNPGCCCFQDTDENGKTGGEVEVLLQCVAKEEEEEEVVQAGVSSVHPADA